MTNKSIESSCEVLEQLLDVTYQIASFRYKQDTSFDIAESQTLLSKLDEKQAQLKDKIQHDVKLANELRRTHDFYIQSKNGYCAGVTNQILELSNYGGKA